MIAILPIVVMANVVRAVKNVAASVVTLPIVAGTNVARAAKSVAAASVVTLPIVAAASVAKAVAVRILTAGRPVAGIV